MKLPHPMLSYFSQRTNWPLSSNLITSTLEKLRQDKAPILDLTESNPTHCGFHYFNKELLLSLTKKENLEYQPHPQGLLQAREEISRYYEKKGMDVAADRIFLTASTSEAYSHLFRLLANPREEILFPQPSYPLFQFLADINDVQLSQYQLQYKDEWTIDIESLKNNLNPSTKAVVLVNPNNPTGSFVKEKELVILNGICKENNLSMISDEVFADFIFKKNSQTRSLGGNGEVLTFTLGGISKALGLPQMKLAWIIVSGPQPLVEAAQARLEIIADTYLSVNTPTQNALADWFSLKGEIQEEIGARLEENLEFLKKELKDFNTAQLFNTEGGWYVILKIPATKTEEEWVLEFLKEYRVFVHPGYFFDFPEEAHVVLSLLPAPQIFKDGVRRILRIL